MFTGQSMPLFCVCTVCWIINTPVWPHLEDKAQVWLRLILILPACHPPYVTLDKEGVALNLSPRTKLHIVTCSQCVCVCSWCSMPHTHTHTHTASLIPPRHTASWYQLVFIYKTVQNYKNTWPSAADNSSHNNDDNNNDNNKKIIIKTPAAFKRCTRIGVAGRVELTVCSLPRQNTTEHNRTQRNNS